MSNRDELAEVLAGELNKQFKSHQVAYFLDGVQDTPTDVTDWVGTGSTLLDQQGVYEELEDALFWVNQGYSFELASINSELEGALQEEAYKRGTTLVGGAAQVALTSAMGDFSGFGSSSNSGYVVPNTQTGATRSVPMSFRSGITRGTQFGGMVDYSKGFGT